MVLQSVLFSKHIWTHRSSQIWLKLHNITPIKKEHLTSNYIRYRIHEPSPLSNYYSKHIGSGIIFVFID